MKACIRLLAIPFCLATGLANAQTDDYQKFRGAVGFGIAIGEGGFPAGGSHARSARAGQGAALVGVTQSQAQAQAGIGLGNISYNGRVSAEGINPGFIVPADAPQDSQFIITAETLGLPDPEITLFEITGAGNVEIAANDNCVQDLTALIGQDIVNGSNACLVQNLGPGLYFVEVADVGGGSGNVLFGVTQPLGSVPALLNISYNGNVEMAGIKPGFIVVQEQQFALTAETLGLPDPEMTLVQITAQRNETIASNDDCDEDLTDHIGRDIRGNGNACLLADLPPGAYFIDVSSADDGAACEDISGAWSGTESGTVMCSIGGEDVTQTLSSTGIIVIEQSGCNISYTLPGVGIERTGTIDGSSINFSGPIAVPDVEGVTFTENNATVEGMVDGDTMTLAGTGSASGSFGGLSFSCEGDAMATFERLNTTGATCSDTGGVYQGTYSLTDCLGDDEAGSFTATVDPANCAAAFVTNEGIFGYGFVTGNTIDISTADLDCGAVSGSGTIDGASLSGSFEYQLGGGGTFSGTKVGNVILFR